jgi:predicted phosphodiesterase
MKVLPIYLIEEIEGIRILISHGTSYSTKGEFNIDDNNFLDKLIRDFDCNVYVFDHTHCPFFKEYKNRYFINPGSVGMPADGTQLE